MRPDAMPSRRRQEPWIRRRATDALRSLAATVLLTAGLATCASPIPSAPTHPPLLALPSALREARMIPQPDGSMRIEAVSAAVAPGQPYRYTAFTHCGFTESTFDFDGSFWRILAPAAFAAEAVTPPAGIGNPDDAGVIVLREPERATWVSARGIAVELARGAREVRAFGCD